MQNYEVDGALECKGRPVSSGEVRFMRARLDEFWREKYERPAPRGYGEFPVFSPWERDPLETLELRRERTAVLENGGWHRRSSLQERYIAYRETTRMLLEGL